MAKRKKKGISEDEGRQLKKKKLISLDTKLEVIKQKAAGMTNVEICKQYDMKESSLRRIFGCKEAITAKGNASRGTSQIITNRSIEMIKMERLLSFWVEDCNSKNIPLSMQLIQEKAKSLYSDICSEMEGDKIQRPFKASQGWFTRYIARSKLHRIKVTGEAASANSEAASKYPTELQTVIQEGGYSDKQIFNLDETGLYWKRMPNHTFIAEKEKTTPGFKVSKDRLTLLLGGNAEGDLKLNPLLIYKSENPRALKHCDKNTLPVIWRSNKRAWVTAKIFEDYFKNYFCPTVEEYFKQQNLSNKALLILDNAPGHPESLKGMNENVEVMFLPPNTTALLQPMDLGVIATFKANYLKFTFEKAIAASTGESAISITDFWKQYNFREALDRINAAWLKISESNMKGVWKRLLSVPNCSNDCCNENISRTVEQIATMGRQLGFNELCSNSVLDTLQANEDLSNSELLLIEHENANEDKNDHSTSDGAE